MTTSVSPHHVVVVGGGLAGLRAVEAARRAGFAGKLTLIGEETEPPYDRPPLSKEFLTDPAAAVPYYDGAAALTTELDVDMLLGDPATGLDVAEKVIMCGDRVVPYDSLLVATGVTARRIPGSDQLAGVHVLRTLSDARAIRAALDDGARSIVVVGAGFVGSEVASAARQRGLDVTIVEAQATLLTRSVGQSAGRALAALHARHDTDLRCGVTVERFEGGGRVEAVVLSDGSRISADLVVVGIGADPATEWLDGSGVPVDDGVVCDPTLRAADGVWAAGDVARWYSPDFERHIRVEHWTNAAEQAAHAMRNLLRPDAATPYRHIPYFWSDWYGQRIQFAGLPVGDPEVVSGAWDANAFVALYRDDDRLVGTLTLNRQGDIMKYRRLIAQRASWDEALEFAAKRQAALSAAC